jgi:hypothetical protein
MKILRISGFVLLCLFAGAAAAHALYLAVNDNGDGSVTVNAAFSTGGSAAHAELRLEDDSGRVLWRGATDDAGSATFRKPQVPYLIILESDSGHSVEQDGPP